MATLQVEMRAERFQSLALAIALVALAGGCATAPRQDPQRLRLSLDADAYRIGQAVVATVWLSNSGSGVLHSPGLDEDTLQFMYGAKGTSERIVREPVHSQAVASQPQELKAGEAAMRRFLFTRLTGEEGDYALLASFRGAASEDGLVYDRVYAEPVPFKVSGPVLYERDPVNGLILKKQTVALATQAAGEGAEVVRAVLVPLGESGLYTWAVLLKGRGPDGSAGESALQVNPYTGQVSPLAIELPSQFFQTGPAGDAEAVPAAAAKR
jgi:hypothetical protein